MWGVFTPPLANHLNNHMLDIFKTNNIPESTELGMGTDRLEDCLNREHFLNYSKNIDYKFNSHGYRDNEWPDDLSNVVWCVGCSAVLGTGQPFNETWPQLLETKINKRCLNIGEEGCSNDTIRMRTEHIHKTYQPKQMIIMWSCFNRRRKDGQDVQHDKADFGATADIKNFANNFKKIKNLDTNVIHLVVPDALLDLEQWDQERFRYFLKKSSLFADEDVDNFLLFSHLDKARDFLHFDIKTSQYITDRIVENIH